MHRLHTLIIYYIIISKNNDSRKINKGGLSTFPPFIFKQRTFKTNQGCALSE